MAARATSPFVEKEYDEAQRRSIGLSFIDVLADMLRNSRFDPDEIEREKGVIVEEMNMYFDTPRDFIGGVYETLLYGDQPLGWDIIGRKETVRGATRETFLDYTGAWYRPNRMVVGVGGQLGDGLQEKLEQITLLPDFKVTEAVESLRG